MSVSSIEGYLTKKEIEEEFNRSHRSLTRDFSQAVRVGDSKILPNLTLRTEDGNELAGTEVTLEMIQELSNQGLSPTWYARREWVQERYAKETGKKKPVRQEEGSESSTVEEKPVATPDDNQLVAALQAHIVRLEQENDRRSNEQQQDKESFMEQIKMFKDMFDTLKEDHTDTKDLLKEVHQVMGKLADVNRLGSAAVPPDADSRKNEKASRQEKALDVESRSTVEAVIVKTPKKAKKTYAKRGSKGSVERKAKATTATKSKMGVAPKGKRTGKTKPKSHKWYETPTLNRFLSRK